MLPWEFVKSDEYSREYSPKVLTHLLIRSSKSLKIIYDKLELEIGDFRQARKILSNAKKRQLESHKTDGYKK